MVAWHSQAKNKEALEKEKVKSKKENLKKVWVHPKGDKCWHPLIYTTHVGCRNNIIFSICSCPYADSHIRKIISMYAYMHQPRGMVYICLYRYSVLTSYNYYIAGGKHATCAGEKQWHKAKEAESR